MALVSMGLDSLHKSTAQACLKGNNFVTSFHLVCERYKGINSLRRQRPKSDGYCPWDWILFINLLPKHV